MEALKNPNKLPQITQSLREQSWIYSDTKPVFLPSNIPEAEQQEVW